MNHLAWAYHLNEENQAALKHYDMVLKVDPGNAFAVVSLMYKFVTFGNLSFII